MTSWREMLRAARHAAGLSQEELAKRIGASPKTIERLEAEGGGRPARSRLLAVCRALALDHDSVNAVLVAAGLEPLSAYPGSAARPLAEVRRMLAGQEFPLLAINSRVEIVAWNDAANRVAELDFARDRPELRQRSLFRIAVDKHFLARVVNWDEVLGLMVGYFVTLNYDILDPSKDPLYFQALVADLMQSDKFLDLMKLWQGAQPETLILRGYFPAQWRVEGERILNFHCTHTGGDLFNAISLIAWYPADAQTWAWLRATVPAAPAAVADTDAGAGETTEAATMNDDSPGLLLRWVRESTGVTQKQLAEQIGISVALLTRLEHDKRRLSAAMIDKISEALQLDGVLANELRLRAGLDPRPSDWAPGVINRHATGVYFRYDTDRLAENLRATRAYLYQQTPPRPYPCLSFDETGTIISVNSLMERALPASLRPSIARNANILDLLLGPALRARLDDWQRVTRELLHNLLHRAPGYPRPRSDLPQMARRIEALAAADPTLLPLLDALMADLSAVSSLEWWPVSLSLRDDDGTPLRYIAALDTWNDYDTIWAFELHPADGPTWERLNADEG